MEEIKASTKQDLHKKFKEVPIRVLREAINTAMSKNRNLEIGKVKFEKFVRKNEVKMVMVELGYINSNDFVV